MNTSRNIIFAVVLVTLLLISTDLNKDDRKKMLFNALLKKYGAVKASKANTVYDAMVKAGLPINILTLAVAQVMHETGVFSGSQRATSVNNYSGITYSGTNEQLATGAKKSNIELPEAKGVFYASYPSAVNWAKDYIRIISRGANKPIQATNPADFAYRLKMNKYYTDSLENYTRNITFYYNFLKKSGI